MAGERLAVSSAASSIGSGDDVFLSLAIPRTWLGLSSDDDLIQALPLTGLGPVSAGMEADAPEILSSLTLSEAWPDPIGMDGDGDDRIDDEWALVRTRKIPTPMTMVWTTRTNSSSEPIRSP